MDVGAALAAGAEVPAAQGDAQQPDGADHPGAGGHPAGLREGGELVGDLAAQPGDGSPPPHRVRLDDPRRVLAEAPQLEVRGGHGLVESRVRRAMVQIRARPLTMIYRCGRWDPQADAGAMAAARGGGHPRVPPLPGRRPRLAAVGHRRQRHRPDDRAAARSRRRPWSLAGRALERSAAHLLVPARRRRAELGHRPGHLDLVRGRARRRRCPTRAWPTSATWAPSRSCSPACWCSRRGRCATWVGSAR